MSVGLLGGCLDKGLLDQTELGQWRKKELTAGIVYKLPTEMDDTISMAERGTDPKQEDLVASTADYVLGKNDLINVSITDLVGPGIETLKQIRVSESGKISMPLVGQITASGLTEAQLEQAIIQAYKDAQLIQNAQVSVNVVEALNRTFTISGSVGAVGEYAIRRADFRLNDALSLARGASSEVGIPFIYINRKVDESAAPMTPAVAPAPAPTAPAGPDLLAPRSQVPNGAPHMLMQDGMAPAAATTTEPAAAATTPTEAGTSEGRYIIVDGKPVLVGGNASTTAPGAAPEMTPSTMAAGEMIPPATSKPFAFNELKEPDNVRVIRIPLEKLKTGELKYNVIIRPGDYIYVPSPVIGEYYMDGHVARRGVYSLSSRQVTVMQALASAGGLDQVAVPWRTEIIRRSGDKQIFATINLDKIAQGLAPDIYLRPDDRINVGTQAWAPFLAALRGGFRITYGFGFLYDRNYSGNNNNN